MTGPQLRQQKLPFAMPASTSEMLPIAVFVSGGGTTLDNLLTKIDDGALNAEVRLVVASRQCRGSGKATQAGLRTSVISPKDFESLEAYSEVVFEKCRALNVELVVMGGFLSLLRIPPDFEGRVMNIHPALIPAFCGQGMYASHVHQAVLDRGCKISGCTVHFVDEQYDHGPIILQRAVPVEDDDTPETLQARVFEAECEAYPEAIRLFGEGKLRIDGRQVTQA